MRRASLVALAATGLAAFAPFAVAQAAPADSSANAPAAHFTLDQAAEFSKQVERDLAARGARVAMVFRTGRPRADLPQGIAYTHGAFWVHRTIVTPGGERLSGYAVNNLYAGGGDGDWPVTESRLVQDWPLDFTRSSAVSDVAVIIPTPEVQRRLLALIDSPAYETLHNPAYSLVANPWAGKSQNCNTFMLDVIAASIWDTAEPARIRANLRAHFTPAVIPAGGLTRLIGPIFDRRLRTEDHQGPIRTSTYESMTAFLADHGWLQESYALTYSPARVSSAARSRTA